MRHWLMKTEPDVYSYDDLAREPTGAGKWDGVRNYQARNFMAEMRVGDRVLVYHSNAKPPHVAGIAEVVREAYPDHTAWDPASKYFDPKSTLATPRWSMVDLRAVEPLPSPVALDALKANPALAEMLVVRKGQRLSVQPVTPAEYDEVIAMAHYASTHGVA